MIRRLCNLVALVSAILFVATAVFAIHARFAHDDLQVFRWDPTTRTFTDFHLWTGRSGMSLHRESTVALPQEDTSTVLAITGPTNSKFGFRVYPSSVADGRPFFLADRYRSTPEVDINQNGLSDCWTVEFRYALPLLVFGLLPGVWFALWFRRWLHHRAMNTQGFAMVPKSENTVARE